MNASFFKPYKGNKFSATKLLVLSYSAYSWRDRSGKVHTPQPSHPKKSLQWSLDEGPSKPRYFAGMSRALCGCKAPTSKEARKAWNEYAYTIYIQRTIGLDPRSKPTHKQFEEAGPAFLALIEKLRPLKVIVTGKTMWNKMPRTSAHRGNNVQAYTLPDGTLVWCLAIPHPSNSTEGFNWKKVSENIRRFRAAKLPRRN